MAASGFTPIILFNSGTASNVPTTGNLAVGELAINYADGKLYYNTGSAIKVLAGAGGAGIAGGSNTQVQYNSSGSLAGSANLTFDGTNLGLAGGTANGVAYLNGSKVLTTGAALTFDGTNLTVGGSATEKLSTNGSLRVSGAVSANATGGILAYQGSSTTMLGAWGANSSTVGQIQFYLSSSDGSVNGELMRLTSTGLGIGTSSPNGRIDVQNNQNATSNFYFRNTDTTNTSSRAALNVIGGNQTISLLAINADNAYFQRSVGNLQFQYAGSTQATLDSSGNLGLGTSSPTFGTGIGLHIQNSTRPNIRMTQSSSSDGYEMFVSGTTFYAADNVGASGGAVIWRNTATRSETMRLDSSGTLLVGTTSANGRITSDGTSNSSNQAVWAKNIDATGSAATYVAWNAATTGNPLFVDFYTETSATRRGTISYNRAGGLVAYNTTSDYRAKDISGPVVDSGALIDSVPVYMGKMKGATQERPMFIAHETPEYAHTGEKDAVDADGNPVYQQMDASALIPVMWAEIQSLRARLKAANIA